MPCGLPQGHSLWLCARASKRCVGAGPPTRGSQLVRRRRRRPRRRSAGACERSAGSAHADGHAGAWLAPERISLRETSFARPHFVGVRQLARRCRAHLAGGETTGRSPANKPVSLVGRQRGALRASRQRRDGTSFRPVCHGVRLRIAAGVRISTAWRRSFASPDCVRCGTAARERRSAHPTPVGRTKCGLARQTEPTRSLLQQTRLRLPGPRPGARGCAPGAAAPPQPQLGRTKCGLLRRLARSRIPLQGTKLRFASARAEVRFCAAQSATPTPVGAAEGWFARQTGASASPQGGDRRSLPRRSLGARLRRASARISTAWRRASLAPD